MSANYAKLVELLGGMFQAESVDLDSGIYRFMKQKGSELRCFLDKELLPQVREAANHEVCAHLVDFFLRYYDNGRFIPARRSLDHACAMASRGEEVKLCWANAGQYFVKSRDSDGQKFDYFIHQDLGGFLERELDFYSKSCLMTSDILEGQDQESIAHYLSGVRVFKSIGQSIIAFLAQVENCKKELWLKKKLIVEANYCLTLDRVPEQMYPEIVENKAQLEEWKKLFAIDRITDHVGQVGYSEPLQTAFLHENPYLVLDTKFFNQNFKDRLLNSIDDLEGRLNGLLIHSENFQGLNFLLNRYLFKVKFIYIDPPYNTGSDDDFCYKDGLKSSSWLSMLENRLQLAKKLLKEDGVMFISIGEEEVASLVHLVKQIFGSENFVSLIARVQKTASNKGSYFAPSIDYLLCVAKNTACLKEFKAEVDESLYKKVEKEGPRQGERYRDDVALYQSSLDITRGSWNQKYFIECPDGSQVIPPCANLPPGEPLPGDGVWRWNRETYEKNKHLLVFKQTKTSPLLDEQGRKAKWNIYTKSYLSDRQEAGTKPRNILEKFINRKGADLLKKMGIKFPYSKPVELIEFLVKITQLEQDDLILDFFAGSGTAGHGVLNTNREQQENKKYILVEMGDFFDTVTKQRMQRAIYSREWKDGLPLSRDGVSQMFKYLRLESYEDVLNNLASPGSGSLLPAEAFENPFTHRLKIAAGNEVRWMTADLVETFNYLLGLRVERVETLEGCKIVCGKLPSEEKALIIWRNLREKANQELGQFFVRQKFTSPEGVPDFVYVNGANALEQLEAEGCSFKVKIIEEEFSRLMFDFAEVG